jgi:hypothetical protein
MYRACSLSTSVDAFPGNVSGTVELVAGASMAVQAAV